MLLRGELKDFLSDNIVGFGSVVTSKDLDKLKRGDCPVCGSYLLSHMSYVETKGYFIRWKCIRQLKGECTYTKVV